MKKIAPSYLTQYLKCGEQYRRRQILKEVVPPGIALHKGSGFHKGAEKNFEEKIVSGLDLPADRVIEIAVETMRYRIKSDGLLLSPDEQSAGLDITLNKAEKSLVSMTGLFSDEVAPRHDPLMIEQYVQMPVPNSDWILSGRIDLINKKNRIVDFKTAGKSPAKNSADLSIQLTVYGLLYWATFGKAPEGYDLDHCVDKKVPAVVSLTTTRQESDFVAVLNTVDTVTKAVDAGSFPPAYGTPGAWWCTPRFCGYWRTCQFIPASMRDQS